MKSLSWTVILLAKLSNALHSPVQPTRLCSGSGDTLPHGIARQVPLAGVIQSSLLLEGISINGEPQALTSSIAPGRLSGCGNAPPMGPISARLCAGISTAELPEAAFHALYTAMGGVAMNDSSMYVVPCMAEAELVFTFGSQNITIHPLDLTNVQSHEFGNGQSLTICTSSYRPATHHGDGGIILGDPFLRNVDTTYNDEDFAETKLEASIRSPSAKVIPLTDAKTASTEFKIARAKTLDALPAQIDVLSINDHIPKALSGRGLNLHSCDTAKLSAISPTTYLTVRPSSNSNNDTGAALRKLTTIAPIALTLLMLILALLIVLTVISTRIFALLKSQASSLRATAHATTPLDREIGDYRD